MVNSRGGGRTLCCFDTHNCCERLNVLVPWWKAHASSHLLPEVIDFQVFQFCEDNLQRATTCDITTHGKGIGSLLKLYVLAPFVAISGRASSCDSAHSWRLYSQAAGTMTWYPTQSHYPDTELTSPCCILLVLHARLGSDKCHFNKSLAWLNLEPNSLICRPLGPRSANYSIAEQLRKYSNSQCLTTFYF